MITWLILLLWYSPAIRLPLRCRLLRHGIWRSDPRTSPAPPGIQPDLFCRLPPKFAAADTDPLRELSSVPLSRVPAPLWREQIPAVIGARAENRSELDLRLEGPAASDSAFSF